MKKIFQKSIRCKILYFLLYICINFQAIYVCKHSTGFWYELFVIIAPILMTLNASCQIVDNMYIYNRYEIKALENVKKVLKECLIFIPIWIIRLVIIKITNVTSSNQYEIIKGFMESPIIYSISSIIIAPILEESFYRCIPYKFIKNKKIYIIISAIIFSMAHVIGSQKPLLCLMQYLPTSIWYSYRYAKTEDLDVTISLHMFNNIIATISILNGI